MLIYLYILNIHTSKRLHVNIPKVRYSDMGNKAE